MSLAITVPTSQPVCARSNFSPPPCSPSLRPFVSPLSPLLALCLLFCLLALACSCCLAWFPLLLHHWKLLSFTVLKRMRKRVATKDFVRRLRGSVSQNLILHLVRTSFGPRSHLVEIAASQNPARRGLGKALQWFATWSAAAATAAAAAVVACAAASEQGVVFSGQRNQKHQKMTWKKNVDPISGVPWGSGWKGWLAWSWIHRRNHRTATSITSKFVCWKCHETWCAMRRMIVLTVQTGGRLLMSGVSGVPCGWRKF